MENLKIEILTLVNQRNVLLDKLNSLVFGAIEIRNVKKGQFIYLHTRVAGMLRTGYAGPYSEEFHSQIMKNNIEAKALKRQVREINKQLKALGYKPYELTEKIKINIDFAKRNMVDTIYKQAVLEGVAVTYLDTETIISGGRINNVSTDDVLKINNLKHAWQFVLDENVATTPSDYNLLCTINKLVEEGFYYNAGRLRIVPVSIGGTAWKPQLPIESQVKEELADIFAIADVYDKAIEALLYVTKKQLFIDGNKRTSVIFANHILVNAGAGLIVIPDSEVSEYKKLLIEYYETDKKENIVAFLTTKCLIKI